MPLGGQTPPTGNRLDAEERPEEGDEEHHLGGDEQRHAVAQAELHDRGVIALEGRLADHVAPPHRHDREHGEDADDQQRPAMPPCMNRTAPPDSTPAAIAPTIGHGLGSTR